MTDRLAMAMQAKTEYPATRLAIETLANDLAAKWALCEDPAQREALWNRLKGLRDIEQILLAAVSEAAIEEYVSDLPEAFQP